MKPRAARSTFTPSIFADFDLANFWEDSDYARKTYVCSPLTDAMIASVEAELGVRLPAAYIELMRFQNGGIPKNQAFPTDTPTSWAEDHVAISGIAGIGRDKRYALCGDAGSKFMQQEWGYPDIGICICDCPSAGHDMIMLDYRKSGRDGEPQVVHVDQSNDYEITFLADNFEAFVRGLVNDSVFDTSDEDLQADLEMIETGSFSTILRTLVERFDGPDLGAAIRRVCKELTLEKGYFALHADEQSVLVYDLLFLLYSAANEIPSPKAYLDAYPQMLVVGDGELSTGGYAPDFVEDWLKQRQSRNEIIRGANGSLQLAGEFRQKLLQTVTSAGQ